jgi:hypothetical protein
MAATSTKDNFLDDIVPRAAGLLAGFVVTWAAGKGLTLDAKEVTAIFITFYALVHRLLAAKRDSLRAKRSLRRGSIAPEYEYAQQKERRDT